ncbi:hypothetical protein JCM19240_342 [Vibrio maritimus]|uniref:Uncharacterized protein n=1 Tax=Vibrio maritimus TaxID=990268 RepID=A0A090T6B3_9VIBR|nr:hypothetical protein JCM19240_342 [Vibrio maritimus]
MLVLLDPINGCFRDFEKVSAFVIPWGSNQDFIFTAHGWI